jgi:Family of unknown function (DUF5335)
MSTATQELDAGKWHEYFDSLTPSIEGKLATIEVMDAQRGDQIDAERMPLQAISYDPKDDVLEIALGGRGVRYPVVLRHFISSPRTISVEESSSITPSAILVTDGDGVRTLISLFEPAELGA